MLTNTKNGSNNSCLKNTSPLLTKGVPLLYNVDIMNKTITKTTNNRYKSTKSKSQDEDELLNIIGALVGMMLATFLFFMIISPITSTPGWGGQLLFFIVGGWILFLFKAFGG